MELWLGLFIWLCGMAMGFAAAIIVMHVKDDADEMEETP
jgi:hypothetical protein